MTAKIIYHIFTDEENQFRLSLESALKLFEKFYKKGRRNIRLYQDYRHSNGLIEEKYLLGIGNLPKE